MRFPSPSFAGKLSLIWKNCFHICRAQNSCFTGKLPAGEVHDDSRLHIRCDLADPIPRYNTVDRDIGPPGLQRAEDAGKKSDFLVPADHDGGAVLPKGVQQSGGKGVGPGIQFFIGKPFFPVDQGGPGQFSHSFSVVPVRSRVSSLYWVYSEEDGGNGIPVHFKA